MRFGSLIVSVVLLGSSASGQTPSPTRLGEQVENALAAPEAMKTFLLQSTMACDQNEEKTKWLVRAAMGKVEDGGLGITYANDKTRTVSEVWRDRKANCLSLTAFYVSACRALGMSAQFAEASRVSVWIRNGGVILNERHVVAIVQVSGSKSLVADFSGYPYTRQTPLIPLDESRFMALFHSNRSIELLLAGHLEEAKIEANMAVREDEDSPMAWNSLGVVEKYLNARSESEQAFRKALDVDPSYGPACGNLEGLLREEGRSSEADHFRDLGLKIREKDPYFHAFLAKEFLASGDTDQALDQIRTALKLQHMEPDFYLILAQVEMDRGRRDAATNAVEKAIHWSLPDQKKRMESKLALIQGQS